MKNVDALIRLTEAHIQQAYDLIDLLEEAEEAVDLLDHERALTREVVEAAGLLPEYQRRLAQASKLRNLVSAVKTAGQGGRPE